MTLMWNEFSEEATRVMLPLPPASWFTKTKTSKHTEMYCMKFRKPCNGIGSMSSLIFCSKWILKHDTHQSLYPMCKGCLSVNVLSVLCVRSWVCTDICQLKLNRTSFFRTSVPVGKSPIGVAFGILWIGSVVRVNVATLKGVAFGISRTITKRLDLTSGSSLGFRLRPHNRRDASPIRAPKKRAFSAPLVRKQRV